MTQWHADIDNGAFEAGGRLVVASQHHVVRVVTADTLSIEVPSGQRMSAVVLDRTGRDIRLMLDDGRAVALEMVLDESLHPPGEGAEVFSRQVWVMH